MKVEVIADSAATEDIARLTRIELNPATEQMDVDLYVFGFANVLRTPGVLEQLLI